MRTRGKGPFKFGRFELKGTLNYMSLVWAVSTAAVTWGIVELVPYLEGQEGFYATIAAVVSVVLRAAQQWLTDNEDKIG